MVRYAGGREACLRVPSLHRAWFGGSAAASDSLRSHAAELEDYARRLREVADEGVELPSIAAVTAFEDQEHAWWTDPATEHLR